MIWPWRANESPKLLADKHSMLSRVKLSHGVCMTVSNGQLEHFVNNVVYLTDKQHPEFVLPKNQNS
jgi:hypothetical protein